MKDESLEYQKKVLHPVLFRLGMIKSLPSVVFWGIRIPYLDEQSCDVTIPFNWRTQNPFKSIYFAALAGAAELSTGALCQLHLAGRGAHSMLVTDFRAQYYKKADTKITFRCEQGLEIQKLLDQLKNSGDSDTITLKSIGINAAGQSVASVEITWSFRKK
jgi:hypothetical protein